VELLRVDRQPRATKVLSPEEIESFLQCRRT
jgi:hypothetical protein